MNSTCTEYTDKINCIFFGTLICSETLSIGSNKVLWLMKVDFMEL